MKTMSITKSSKSLLRCLVAFFAIAASKAECKDAITFQAHDGSERLQLAFSPDGKLLASGRQYARAGHLVIWDLSRANRRVTAPNKTGAWCVAFFPNGATLASGSQNGQVTLWDVKTLLGK